MFTETLEDTYAETQEATHLAYSVGRLLKKKFPKTARVMHYVGVCDSV